MSKFECPVVRVRVEPHPNADQIEIARVGGYRSIVRKGQFRDGRLAVYIPEGAIVPDWMLGAMELRGKLSGSARNRVKAIKLRGVLSQGLLYPVDSVGAMSEEDTPTHFVSVPDTDGFSVMIVCKEGDDLAELLGVIKYEPTIPVQMAGKIAGCDPATAIKYDFDSIQKKMDLFAFGEEVVITEKIHGTLCMIGVLPESRASLEARDRYMPLEVDGQRCYGVVSSKGLGAKGFMLDVSDTNNLYVQHAMPIWQRLADEFDGELTMSTPTSVFLFGEIYGSGVQDLQYGLAGNQTRFVAFDLYTEADGFSSYHPLKVICTRMSVAMVPELYRGPFSHEVLTHLVRQESVLARHNGARQLSEGVVVRPEFERADYRGNRAIAKLVGEAYLLRKNGTEYA
jgi:RNA ligase (TIGR02306 family)